MLVPVLHNSSSSNSTTVFSPQLYTTVCWGIMTASLSVKKRTPAHLVQPMSSYTPPPPPLPPPIATTLSFPPKLPPRYEVCLHQMTSIFMTRCRELSSCMWIMSYMYVTVPVDVTIHYTTNVIILQTCPSGSLMLQTQRQAGRIQMIPSVCLIYTLLIYMVIIQFLPTAGTMIITAAIGKECIMIMNSDDYEQFQLHVNSF